MTDHISVGKTASYYDNETIARFYQELWGGSDIHIGLYQTGNETIAQACEAMTRRLLRLAGATSGQRVLDIACGYGGTLRILAEIGCRASGIDISKVCVARARQLNASAGLGNKIEVAEGDYHDIDRVSGSLDLVICQEAIIHSMDRPAVFREVFRILRPGAVFAVSDIVLAETGDPEIAAMAFSRLGARADATPKCYRSMAESAGFCVHFFEERPADIRTHYDKLAEELERPELQYDPKLASIRESITTWQRALEGGHITWISAVGRKPL
jgi:sarcosine/dimethylglycine N-methyltransferase